MLHVVLVVSFTKTVQIKYFSPLILRHWSTYPSLCVLTTIICRCGPIFWVRIQNLGVHVLFFMHNKFLGLLKCCGLHFKPRFFCIEPFKPNIISHILNKSATTNKNNATPTYIMEAHARLYISITSRNKLKSKENS